MRRRSQAQSPAYLPHMGYVSPMSPVADPDSSISRGTGAWWLGEAHADFIQVSSEILSGMVEDTQARWSVSNILFLERNEGRRDLFTSWLYYQSLPRHS